MLRIKKEVDLKELEKWGAEPGREYYILEILEVSCDRR